MDQERIIIQGISKPRSEDHIDGENKRQSTKFIPSHTYISPRSHAFKQITQPETTEKSIGRIRRTYLLLLDAEKTCPPASQPPASFRIDDENGLVDDDDRRLEDPQVLPLVSIDHH
jgi:hypothetical protein